jgi:hypothetical protein
MRRTFRTRAAACFALATTLAASGCDQSSLPAPSNAGGIPITERFEGTLQPAGSAFYSFRMSEAGAVQITLLSMTGPGVPAGATFPIGIGTPAGTSCGATINATIAPGPSPQYTTTKTTGVYCLLIFDNNLLTAPATFALNISHPR